MIEWSLNDDRMTDSDRYSWAADRGSQARR
jgi:hypothetical protein